MIGLIRQLPDEVILRGPNLAVYKAWFLLVSGQLQMASALLNHIERTYGNAAPGEDHRGLLSFVAMQQAYIAEITEGPTVRRVDPSRLVHVAESRGGMRNSAEVILAYVLYRNEEFAEAARLLQMTLDRDMRTGATNGIPIVGSRLARMWLVEGRLQEAAALCQSSLSMIEPRGKWRFYVAGNLSLVLGDVLREWDRLDEAEANIRTGLQDNAPWASRTPMPSAIRRWPACSSLAATRPALRPRWRSRPNSPRAARSPRTWPARRERRRCGSG